MTRHAVSNNCKYSVRLSCRSALEMLAKSPQDLEQLADAVAFQKKLVDDKARIVGRFEPLRCVQSGGCTLSLAEALAAAV